MSGTEAAGSMAWFPFAFPSDFVSTTSASPALQRLVTAGPTSEDGGRHYFSPTTYPPDLSKKSFAWLKAVIEGRRGENSS